MARSKTKVKENGLEGAKRRSTNEVDHWGFLEEIEAPMWVDLTLEPMLMREDNDDQWFHKSHLFHHCSARQLRSKFSHPDVRNDFFNFNLQGVSSPKLPSSVSKSRGKNYQSRNQGSNGQLSMNKDHPVNDMGGRISSLDAGSSQESKNKGSCRNRDGASCSSSSLHCDNSCTTTVSCSSHGMAEDSDTRSVLNSQLVSTSEGVSTSTITAESSQQQHPKVLELSKEVCGNPSDLLNALKTNLRKSCAIRPAMRLETCDDRDFKNRISSSGKSSVGSSNNGCNIQRKASAILQKPDHRRQIKGEMNVNRGSKGRYSNFKKPTESTSHHRFLVKKIPGGLKQNIGKNLNVRDLGKLAQPVKRRLEASNITKAPVLASHANKSKLECRHATAASTSRGAPKLKVLSQMTQKNSSNESRVTSQVKDSRIGSGSQFKRLPCSGKENMMRRAVLGQKPDVKDKLSVVQVTEHKISQLELENNVGRAAAVGPKPQVRAGRGKDNKLSSNAHVYLR